MNRVIQEIEAEIEKLDLGTMRSNVGRITMLADAVATLSGLSEAMFNEVLEFPGGTSGIVLNLEEDQVGCVILGETAHLRQGDEVKRTGKLLSVPVGKGLLGRVVDALGRPLDGKGPIAASATYPIERKAPGILPRHPVNQPLQTGVMAIDAMIPIGRGQRELIIGDRATGKSTVAVDTLINQARINRQALQAATATGQAEEFRPVYGVYVAIGQKNSDIARLVSLLESHGALEYCIIVTAAASENPANQYIAPYTGCSMGEWFMENGMDALIIYDDLSKHAVAYRQISLVLKRPSGREAYPGDIFFLHSRLLERAARLGKDSGGGSLTALPIIETQAGDVSAYIPTNVISITDGQIFLEKELFNQGIRPAVSVGLSVSRVGSAAQTKAIKKVAGKVKLQLAQYRELEAFAQFGSDLDEQAHKRLARGQRMVELFKQKLQDPVPASVQACLLWAMEKGFFNAIEPRDVVQATQNLREYLDAAGQALLAELDLQKQFSPQLEEKLEEVLNVWSSTFVAKEANRTV